MRAFIRSILVTVVALLGAAVLAIGSTLTGAVAALADPAALIMGGTGRPWPEDTYVANVMKRYIEPNTVCGTETCETRKVYGPEEFWPIYGGFSGLTFNQSTYEGLGNLDAALQQQLQSEPDEKVVIFGYSQSGRITNLELRNLADPDYAVGNDRIVPDADQLEVVLIGNWSRPNGGVGSRFSGVTIPILDVTFDGPTPTDTGYKMTDIAYEYDIIADTPLYPGNLLAMANAIAGFWYVHGTYPDPTRTTTTFPWGSDSEASFEELLASATMQKYPGKGQDPEGNPDEWDNTYYLIPSTHLPILQPFRDLAAATGTTALVEPVMLLIEPTLKVLIDTGYDRTIPMGQPTPARLIPRINPIRLTIDLVEAVQQGIQDAFGGGSQTTIAPTVEDTDAAAVRTVAEPVRAPAPDATVEKVEVVKPLSRIKTRADDATVEEATQPLEVVETNVREIADKAVQPGKTEAADRTDTRTRTDVRGETRDRDKNANRDARRDKTDRDRKSDSDDAAA